MKAIALRQGAENVELVDLPTPTPQPGEVLIKVLRNGLCGTDREIIHRRIPDVPQGEDILILGHEMMGRVEEVATEADTDLVPGDLVTVMVRRGCGKCNACLRGHADYCYTGEYKERGIHKIHGFLTEYIVDDPQYVIKIDPAIGDIGCMAEPMSVVIKAYEVAKQLMNRVCFDGACSYRNVTEGALVAGHGPIGMLAAMMLKLDGWDVSVLGRRVENDRQRTFIEAFGAKYINSEEEDEVALAEERGGFLVIIEATGLSDLTFHLPKLLSRNGILVLTGVPRGPKEVCIDGNTHMARLVRFNQTITGTVNASRQNFIDALATLKRVRQTWPELAAQLITSRYTLENWQDAFTGKGRDEIKVVVEF